MVISWADSSGQTGMAENAYDYVMQHKGKGDLPEQAPQTRIDNAFDQIAPKRLYDQNNPLTWGLGEINQNIDSMMKDPGPKQRQENIQQELDSGQQRTPLEHQIQARRSGAADSEGVSTYDVPGSDRESRMYLNEMYSKFKKQPLEGPHKNLTEQEYKDLLWDTPITSSKGGGPSAADIQEMLDVTDEEHKASYDEAVKLLGKDNVIGGILPSGRIRMRKDSEGYQEYIKNIPDDVSVHDMGDGSVILRKKPGGKPPVVGSLQDELGDPSQIPTSTYQQFADYVRDLRVKFTGEPDKWSGKEVVGDFLDKAMSVMGGGIRRPPGGPRGGLGRGLSSSIGEERIQSAAMKVGDKVYEGENHGIAYEKAGDHHPAATVEEGFTTSKGRFVSREEAAQIAKKQEQVLLEARQTENLHSGELKYGFERIPKPPAETSQAQWAEYEKLSSQGKTTKQILKATKMDPEVVRDALGRDNLALAAFNSENALTEAYFNQLKTMPPELEKAFRAKGVSVKDLKSFTRSLPEEDLAQIFQKLPENVKTWWQAGELRRQKIDEGKKGTQIPKGSSEGEPLGPKPPRGTVKAGWDESPKKWSDLDPLERLMKMDEVIKKNPNLRQVPWGWETEEVQKLTHQRYTKYMDEGFPETYKEHLDLIKKK